MKRSDIKHAMRVRYGTKFGFVVEPRARNEFMQANEPDRVLVKMEDGRDLYVVPRDLKLTGRVT